MTHQPPTGRSPFLVLAVITLVSLVVFSFHDNEQRTYLTEFGGQHHFPGPSPCSPTAPAHIAGIRRLTALTAATNSSDPAPEAIDKAKAAEIMGRDLDDERRTRKFLELVILPLGVCFMMIMLLRRGFLN